MRNLSYLASHVQEGMALIRLFSRVVEDAYQEWSIPRALQMLQIEKRVRDGGSF